MQRERQKILASLTCIKCTMINALPAIHKKPSGYLLPQNKKSGYGKARMNEERLLPQNIEAEMSLLGSLLIDKEAMIKIGDLVTADDFYVQKHREIYEAISELYRRHEPVDILTLTNRLDEKGLLQTIGGRAYLMQISNTVPTSSHVSNYANIIQKKSTLRRLIHAAQDITAIGFDATEDVEAMLDRAEQTLFGVSQKYLKTAFTPITSVLDGAFERIDEMHRDKGKMRGVPSGFTELDKLLGGLQNSDLIVLAARPSCGKTSLSLDVLRHAAVRKKTAVGYFSLEMSKEQVVDRLICAESNVDLWKMRGGHLTTQGENDDFSRIGHAIGNLAEAPVYIDDTASANIMEIRTKARRLQMEHGLGLLIIDYLQLMESRSGGSDNRVQEVAEITRGLKAIARELNVPVLALSQLSRAVEQGKPAIPKLSHLRESGSIEQDADIVMFIYRKAVDKNYRQEDLSPEERHTAEIHIAKHRNGPTGVVKLFFDESRASFRNLAKQQHPPSSPALASAARMQTISPPSQNLDAPITTTAPPGVPF